MNEIRCCCSELKRRQKMDKKAQEKVEKATSAPPKPAANATTKGTSDEDLDPSVSAFCLELYLLTFADAQEYRKMRINAIVAQRSAGQNPFPHKFHVEMSLADFIATYEYLTVDQLLADKSVRLAGRVMAKRENSAKLFFYDLHAGGKSIQLMANARFAHANSIDSASSCDRYHKHESVDGALHAVHERVRRGDIIGVVGHPTRSKTGELSLMVRHITNEIGSV